MNKYHIIAIILVICGIGLVGYSIVSGEGTAGVVLFIPVFYGSGLWSFLGVLCLIAGIFLAFFGFVSRTVENGEIETQPATRPRTEKSIKGGGVVLIGPIPVIFGSDAKTAIVLVILALMLIIAVAFLFYLR